MTSKQVQPVSRVPLAYVRGKIKSKAVLIKILIDSGNLCSDLISESLAKQLDLKVDTSERKMVGTASSNGKVEIVGRAKPMLIYFENLKFPVVISPLVVKDLAHPINLGERFLRRYKATIQFSENFTRLGIGNHSVELKPPGFNLTEPTVDSRFKAILDWHKFAGRNPTISSQENVLDLRKSKPLPGMNTAGTPGNEVLNILWDTHIPVYCVENTIIKAGTAQAVKVKFKGEKLPCEHQTYFFEPEKNGKHVHNDILAHPGIYSSQRGEGVTIANYGARDGYIEKGDFLGNAKLVEVEFTEINALSHKPRKELTKEEENERENFVRTSLELEKNEMLKNHPDIKEKIINIFLHNFEALAIDEYDYGRTDLIQYSIKLEPDAKPVKMKARPLNPIQEKSLDKQIKAWLAAGVIEPANSPWSAALVPVRKKDTSDIRWAIDYRLLNSVTVEDAYYLSRIDTSLQKLTGSKIFSVLDSAGAFHTIPVEPESRPYTAFSSCFGQFQFLRLPFGVRNGVQAYSRLIDMALAHLPQTFAMAYVDDLIVFSKTITEHIGHLEEIIKVHKRAGMKIKLKKCKIFSDQVNYLGHSVSKDGIQMIKKYVSRILDWPLPETGKDLKSFLGFCGYYRSFIPRYSHLTAELESLKMEEVPKWTDELRRKFEELKKAFETAPTRGFPDYESENPFIIDTDYSSVAQSGILSQVQQGRERFLGCVAKKNNKAEANYPSYKGELAAIIFTLRKFEHVLRAKKFVIRTDSGPLQFLKTCKKTTGIFARFHNYLATFNFTVEHRAGKKHVTADALSRRPGLKEELDNEREELPPKSYFHGVEDNIYSSGTDLVKDEKISILRPNSHSPTDLENGCQNSQRRERGRQREGRFDTWGEKRASPYRDAAKPSVRKQLYSDLSEINKIYLNEQEKDSDLSKIRQWVIEGNFPTDRKRLNKVQKMYFDLRQQMRICPKTGLLFIETESSKRVCVPKSMWEELFEKFHEESQHPGLHETLRKLKRNFYFPNMQVYLNLRITNCVKCLGKYTSEQGDRKAKPSNYTEEWQYFNQNVYIDLVGPFTPGKFRGKVVKYILTMQDGFSRFLAAVPVEDATAETAARALLENWIFQFGVFETLKSDNGKSFVSSVFSNVLKSLNIQQNLTPLYNPCSNRVERAHQTLLRLVRMDKDTNVGNWPQKIQMAVFWYNSSMNNTTGVSPFKAVFGQETFLPLSYILPKFPPTAYKNFVSLIQEKQNLMRQVHNTMIQNQADYALILDQNPNPQKYTLQIGDTCYYFANVAKERGTKKLLASWLGPFVIVSIVSDSVVRIRWKNPVTTRMKNRVISVNVSRIRKIDHNVRDPDKKYFFADKTVQGQSKDEDSFADMLDGGLEDELDGSIIIRNEINSEKSFDNCHKEREVLVEPNSRTEKVVLDKNITESHGELINTGPGADLVIQTPVEGGEEGMVQGEPITPEKGGKRGEERAPERKGEPEPLPPRRAKLEALEKIRNCLNSLADLFSNFYLD